MAMRYGTFPLVHEVRRDFVVPINRLMLLMEVERALASNNLSDHWFRWAVDEALAVYYNDKQAGMVSKGKLWRVTSHRIRLVNDTMICAQSVIK